MATRHPVTVQGSAPVRAIGERLILPLPQDASAQLPSRGQVAVTAELAGHECSTVVEPDGRRGHWIGVDAALAETLGASDGAPIDFTLTTVADWPEPQVPSDLKAALAGADEAREQWRDITPMARWEWVRWIGATRSPETRAKRVDVTVDKLLHGSRRPCCFDLSSCTDPELSRSGKLIATP